ncbi:MAG: hypothetical protein ACPGXK_08965 [Phycisphaerae bacterium]
MIQGKILYATCVMVFGGALMMSAPVTAAENAADSAREDAVRNTKSVTIPSAEEIRLGAIKVPEGTRHYEVFYSQGGGIAGENLPEGADRPVYSNVPPPDILFPPGPGRRIADDLVTVAVGGCAISGYEMVVGRTANRCSLDQQACNEDDDCANIGGQTCEPWPDAGFTVDFGLYDGCPTEGGQLIAGTEGSMSFPENATYTMIVDLSKAPVFHDGQLWLGVEFDRAGAGWVVGTPASVGFTENSYDFPIPSFACSARLGGTLYAGFHARIFCANDPPFEREFLAYFNPEVTGAPIIHPTGASNRFLADDLSLIVDDCQMTSFSVGIQGGAPFTSDIELWRGCSPTQLIEGTQRTFEAVGDGSPEIARFSFDPPINIGSENLWVAVKNSIGNAGPLQANQATLGETDVSFGIFDWPGQTPGCGWVLVGTHTGFNASVSCLGEAPTGACCDLLTINGPGDQPTCTEVTQIACTGALTRYNQGTSCPNTCLIDNTPCDTDGDCAPNACTITGDPCTTTDDCPEPDETCEPQGCVQLGESFEPACGTSACCTPPEYTEGEGCFELTVDECDDIQDSLGNKAVWNRGIFCDNQEFECFRWVCRVAEGDCTVAESGRIGCGVPACCDRICDQDDWCCTVEWDQTCADRVIDENFGCLEILAGGGGDDCTDALEADISSGFCSGGAPCDPANGNDDCPGLEVCNLPSIKVFTTTATAGANETFCCTDLPGGSAGGGGVWVRFTPVTSSIQITTSDAGPGDAVDPVIEVYRVDDNSSPEAACASLVQLGCDDNSGFQNQSELNLYGLTPGTEHYLLIAGRGANAQGQYQINFEGPAPDENNAPANDKCDNAIQIASAGSFPFDMTGSDVECPWETCLPNTDPQDPDPSLIDEDIWYSYFPVASGLLTIDTCGPDDSAIVVYRSGTCPPEVMDRVACSNDGDKGCSPGAQVSVNVTGGQLYLVRVTGTTRDDNGPVGSITFSSIDADCNFNGVPDSEDIANGLPDCNGNGIPDECNDSCSGIEGSTPPSGGIDARQPSDPDGGNPAGLDAVLLNFSSDTSGIMAGEFSISSTNGVAPGIASLLSAGNDLTVMLDAGIPYGGYTTITFDTSGDEVCIGAMPADVDADGTRDSEDIQALIDHLDGNSTLPIWSVDINRDGQAGPEDILRVIDLLNGGGNYGTSHGDSIVGSCN